MIAMALDHDGAVPLQTQICDWIRARVETGALPAGQRLPSSRDLARSLGVSRNTVTLAFDRLMSEGCLALRPGVGAFVEASAPRRPQRVEPAATPAAFAEEARTEIAAPALLTRNDPRAAFDLWYGRTDARLFPTQIWRRLAHGALAASARGLSEYGPVGGEPRLRAAIARHLAAARDIRAEPDQILVASGAQEAINIAARLLLDAGDCALIEDPGYAAAARVFEARGARLGAGRVDADGLDPAALGEARPRLVYVTPSHQFPTGVVMSLERRRALIDQCRACGGFILEDDYDGELVFDAAPLPAIAALEGLQRTLYVGSFSKTLGGGLRLGYLVAPKSLVAAAEAIKSLMSYGQSWLDQQILALFLESGQYRRHVNRLRAAGRERRDAAMAGLRGVFGERVEITGAGGGTHLYGRLPDGADAQRLSAAARAAGVGLHGAVDCGARGDAASLRRSLLVGFAALTPRELGLAFARLAEVASSPLARQESQAAG